MVYHFDGDVDVDVDVDVFIENSTIKGIPYLSAFKCVND